MNDVQLVVAGGGGSDRQCRSSHDNCCLPCAWTLVAHVSKTMAQCTQNTLVYYTHISQGSVSEFQAWWE